MHAHDMRTCMDARNSAADRRKILILEQDDYLASLMHLLLYREGFATVAISDVQQLPLQLASDTTPMLLFISHRWLREDDPRVLKMLRKHKALRGVPLIMLMNYYDLDLIERVSALGITDHLLQPFEPAVLLETIQKYAGGIPLN